MSNESEQALPTPASERSDCNRWCRCQICPAGRADGASLRLADKERAEVEEAMERQEKSAQHGLSV